MFLRSLSMRGFKSFADRTVLEVEPGVTVIVGPNGSGKSNVVDALAWVLGTHSAKKVRGGSMADVIFAGSPTRPAAPRARVEIVIDNSDGLLSGAGVGTAASAAEFTEVRVARTIHPDGESTYEINGEEVRALDVQELLSDTGLGRELHTIVGQGQLDEILNAKPEDRRRYIEEAAGILKHRRRRERALRKLEQVDAHTETLRSVLRELRRQLRPLERQAEAADRHAALQAELRDVRVRRAALELDGIDREVAAAHGGAAGTADEEQRADQRRTEARERLEATEAELARLGGALERAQGLVYRLTSRAERLHGTGELIEARRRHLAEHVEEPLAGRAPAELRAQAEALEAQRIERERQRDADRLALSEASAARRTAETRRREHEERAQAERQRHAERRERLLRWEARVSAVRGAIAAGEAELQRVAASLGDLEERRAATQGDVARIQEQIQQLDVSEVELTAALESAEHAVREHERLVEELDARLRELDAELASQRARAEALRAALADGDAGATKLVAERFDGLLGRVADHVRVEPGGDTALAAALGPLGDAVVLETPRRARDAVAWLRETGGGRAVILAGGAHASPAPDPDLVGELARADATPVSELLSPTDTSPTATGVVALLRDLLSATFVVADWAAAAHLHTEHPGLTFVTAAGDVAGPHGYHAGGSPERSAVVTASAADAATRRADELAADRVALERERAEALARLAAARDVLRTATGRINESDARITGAAERLAMLGQELSALTTQHTLVATQQGELSSALARDRTTLATLEAEGPGDDTPPAEPVPVDAEVAGLEEAVDAAREHELEARLALERTGEQLLHLERQVAALRTEAAEVEAALAAAARRRELRRLGVERCAELALVVRDVAAALERAVADATTERDGLRSRLGELQSSLAAHRDELAEATATRDELRERRHVAELRHAELRNRRDALVERVRAELALSPDELRAEHPEPGAYDADELASREEVLVRRIGLLGRVNPLALEEFRALEERHAFLSGQLDDLRRSRRDLEEVVVAVDQRIREIFREAYDDIAREFELTFATVFPGGHGRLVLTDPDDLMTTGIEVEARPPGKKVTRLSLLSGGERSLTVLAFVFAIFRARPSPFYVLDEVDAALDDVNLQRLLKIVRSFRGHAQIIMVTHQKRSMEIADVLYGITMGRDAVSKVVAERLREPSPTSALDARASDAPTEALSTPVAG